VHEETAWAYEMMDAENVLQEWQGMRWHWGRKGLYAPWKAHAPSVILYRTARGLDDQAEGVKPGPMDSIAHCQVLPKT